jgi:ABC-type bacteriocin/lantibiotic exporter with double-glycine peptidase domain
MVNFIRLLSYIPLLRHAVLPLFLLVFLTLCKAGYVLLNLILMPAVFDRLFVSFDVIVLIKVMFLSLLLLLWTLFLDVTIETMAGHLQFKLSMRIKVALMKKAFRLPSSFFSQSSSGALAKLIIRDTEQVTVGLKEIVMISNHITLAVIIGYGCYHIADWYFKIYCSLAVLILIWNVMLRPLFTKMIEKNSNLGTEAYSTLWGTLGHFRTIKILGLEKKKYNEFADLQQRQKKSQQRVEFTNYLISSINQPLMTLGYTLILYIVLQKVQSGEYSLGMMAAFTAVIYTMLTPIVSLVQSYSGLQMGLVGAKLLKNFKLTDSEESGKKKLKKLDGDIVVENVNFGYNSDRQILKNISLRIPFGKHVGIVGQTGCGKSTLLSLFLKMHTGYTGSIHYGSLDLKDIQNDSLRDSISYLGQDSLCFLGNIRNNIDVHNKRSDEEILEYCENAQLMNVIDKLEDGIYSSVQDNTLSGGERQRLFLARALAKGGDVLIFDEATSGLDPKTEHLVLETLDRLRKGRTSITVTHRSSNLVNCDWVYVIHDGQIVEEGTYATLAQNNGHFQNLFLTNQGESS